MDEFQSLNHTKWDCKYHVVFISKGRRKILFRHLRRHLGEVFRRLAEQKESRIEEGHLMPDHVHMLVSILPKYAVPQVVGYIRARAPFIWPGPMAKGGATSQVSTFGRVAILFPRWAGTRKPSATTSAHTRLTMPGWIR